MGIANAEDANITARINAGINVFFVMIYPLLFVIIILHLHFRDCVKTVSYIKAASADKFANYGVVRDTVIVEGGNEP